MLRATEGGTLRPELSAVVAPADPDATARFQLVPDGVDGELGDVRDELWSTGQIAGFDPAVHTHRLASRRLKSVFNSSGREVAALRERAGTSFAHVHPDDLREIGVVDGDVIEVVSPRGVIRTVARAAEDVRPGTVSMAHAWGDLPGEHGPPIQPDTLGDCTGRLIDNASGFDPLTGLPVQSAIPVGLRPVVP